MHKTAVSLVAVHTHTHTSNLLKNGGDVNGIARN